MDRQVPGTAVCVSESSGEEGFTSMSHGRQASVRKRTRKRKRRRRRRRRRRRGRHQVRGVSASTASRRTEPFIYL